MKFTVSILTYTALDHTKRCVESVLANSDHAQTRLLLTANGSVEAYEYFSTIEDAYENVAVIYNENNHGFIEPNKSALKSANSEFFVMLNDDAIVSGGWLEKLEAPFLYDPLCALSGPTGGKFRHGPAMPETQWLEGSCIMGRTAILKSVGLFSDYLKFATWEEIDLGFRLIEKGYTLHLTPFDFGHAGKATRRKIVGMDSIEKANLNEVRKRFPQYFSNASRHSERIGRGVTNRPNGLHERPGPRGRSIATVARWPGSLQRMVIRQFYEPSSHSSKMVLARMDRGRRCSRRAGEW